MRVLVLGAYGLIGSAIVARLARDGHEVIAAGRSRGYAAQRLGAASFIRIDLAEAATGPWTALLAGIEAVVHAAGALEDGWADRVEATQGAGTCAFFDACRAAGVKRVVHISAAGAAPDAASVFMRSKAAADSHLLASGLDCVILKPTLVIDRQAHGGTALLRALAALPGVMALPPPGRPIQTIDMDDLAESVARLIAPGTARGLALEATHPTGHALAEIAGAYRSWFGLGPARLRFSTPGWLMGLLYAAGSAAAWLGWRNPMRRSAGAALAAGVSGDPSGWIAATGIAPRSLAESLAARPAAVQDLWHARLFLLKPVIFVMLATIWIASGLIALGPGREAALALLGAAGFGGASLGLLWLTAGLDLAIGIAIAFRPLAGWGLAASALVTLAYLVGGTLFLPGLWADPLGPLVKAFAILGLTGAAAAILPSR